MSDRSTPLPNSQSSGMDASRQASLLAKFMDGALNEAEMAEWNEALSANEQLRDAFVATCLQRDLLPQVLTSAEDIIDASQLVDIPVLASCYSVLDNAWHGTIGVYRNAAGYFEDHPMKLAYLITTMLFLVAAPILWHWKVSTAGVSLAELAKMSASPAALSKDGKLVEKNPVVGRITDMIDCRWRVQGSGGKVQGPRAESQKSLVVLGDKLTITSGLLEITYQTGSKVVLYGPCTFNVETNGGFLAVGRLTGKMEKKVGSGQWAVDRKVGVRVGSESASTLQIPKTLNPEIPSSNPQSLIPNPFVIATPTAIVTDLGTEFGIDVLPDQATTIHVVRGEVEATRDPKTGGRAIHERIRAGEAVYIASLNELPVRIDMSERSRPAQQGRLANAKGAGTRVVLAPELRASLRNVHDARMARYIPKPVGLVASAYRHVWDKDGHPLAENDRAAAFLVATDGIFGRGVAGESPRSSFDTALVASGQWLVASAMSEGRGARDEGQKVGVRVESKNESKLQIPKSLNPQIPNSSLSTTHYPLSTSFVGLRYDHPIRFDRIKVFLGRQSAEGGSWTELPKVFILKHPVDTDTTSPESDPANWRELPSHYFFGTPFGGRPGVNPGEVIEYPLTGTPDEQRTGYGWAVGGVKANGSVGFISITELRAYTTPDDEEIERNREMKNSDKKDLREERLTPKHKVAKNS